MTYKKIFSILALLLTITACQTGRKAQRTRTFLPDTLVTSQTREVIEDAKTTTDSTDEASSSRANINKVEKYAAETWQGQLQLVMDSITNIDLFETTQLGLCIFDLTDDHMLYAVNANHRLRPASNQKLVTAIAALDLLDPDIHFTPTVLKPGWGWCWDDEETGMTEFKAGGKRWNADTLYHETRECTLREILTPTMKKSDNMKAESIFWLLPGNKNLSKVTRKDCVRMIDQVISKTAHTTTDYVIADGSGVSLYDYLTPHLLVMLLRHAYQNQNIFSILYPALPIAGIDGTLEKRMKGTRAEANVHAKTGTVTGVSTLSGYCTHPSGHILAFSIMNQGLPKAAIGRAYQDEVCEILCGQ